MNYKRIEGTASRERRLRREREFEELMEWTRNRPGGYTGRTRSQDPEVRRRWCSYFGFSFSKSKPRPSFPWVRGRQTSDEPSSESSIDESSSNSSHYTTGSSDHAVMEPDSWATDKGPGRMMVADESRFIVTADQYVLAFHLDGEIDSESSFWSKQMGGYHELWQSAGLLLENDEFIEVSQNSSSRFKSHLTSFVSYFRLSVIL